ncbi:MAG: hypothetical protein JNG89_17435 [Planctomycetaceae bacterium]|nr:hypothetical protein [Planctomycetaceae bacterium]
MTDATENLEQTAAVAAPPPGRVRPDISVLQDRFPPWLKLSPLVAGCTAVLGLLYLFLSYSPIWHTDIWGHLSYGRWIAQSGYVPSTEPLLPLAQGMPFVDTAWLCQWLAFQAYERWGIAALQGMYAGAVTAMVALLGLTLLRRTKLVPPTVFGLLTFGWLNYQPLAVQRPQIAGMLCFMLLFCWLTSPGWRRWYWLAVPALFVVWANLHGSFICGLLLMFLLALGTAIDGGRRLKESAGALRFKPAVRLFLLLELAAAAALVNPYGIGIYAETLSFAGSPNLADLVEWDPLNVRMPHGLAAAAVVGLLTLAYRMSPRRVRLAEGLVLFVFGLLALWHSRMLVWWSIPAAYYLGMHVGAIWTMNDKSVPRPARCSGRWTVVTVGLAWICFAYTPLGLVLLHGKPAGPAADQQFRRSVSQQTPVAAVAYLGEKQLPGPLFNTYEWGDYVQWVSPPGLPAFVNSHAHVIPTDVWNDYMQISHAGEGWEFGLDQYGINTVLIDQRVRGPLIASLKRNARWRIDYEDDVAAIFVRRKLIGRHEEGEKQEGTKSDGGGAAAH